MTVRGVGVMEKCTFCVQRIQEERFKAELAGEPLADGQVRDRLPAGMPGAGDHVR